MPNKISVSGNLSHMTKVMEMLAMKRCRVALPGEDIDDPSAVFRCTAAGSYFGFIMVFNHVVYTSMG